MKSMASKYHMILSQTLQGGAAWDDFVARTPGGHHVQTSCWAQVKATLGWEAARLSIEEDGRIIAGAQLLFRRIPLAGSIGYVTKGPIMASTDPELAQSVLQGILQVARLHRCQMLVIQPPNNGEYLPAIMESRGFRMESLQLGSTASLVIDLDQGLELVKEQLTHETRRNIGRSQRAGIVVSEGSFADLDSFYALHLATARRQGFLPYQRGYFDALWQAFSPQRWVTLMFASYKEEIVSAQLLIAFGGVVMAKGIGWSGSHGKCYPNYALLWDSVRWAAAHGYQYFDFEGVDLQGAQGRLDGKAVTVSGADAFKYGFGGRVVLFPSAYVHLPNKVISWLYHHRPSFIEKRATGIVERLKRIRSGRAGDR
jgi:peptidoglycan pentaglycine glycine transferase (the first glycine)